MPELDRRELTTVLAALKRMQCEMKNYCGGESPFEMEIAEAGHDPLSCSEIDALCERLNRSEPSTACAICGKQPDPFSDGHNEHDESIGRHWICERCVTNTTPEEIADHLGLDAAVVYDSMGLEQPQANEE